jgi:hypothetical protein
MLGLGFCGTMLQHCDHSKHLLNKKVTLHGFDPVQRVISSFALYKDLQHKSLLPFVVKKVIVAKIKLCGIDSDHIWPPSTVAADILPRAVEKCKG